jgi:hypothetical protein
VTRFWDTFISLEDHVVCYQLRLVDRCLDSFDLLGQSLNFTDQTPDPKMLSKKRQKSKKSTATSSPPQSKSKKASSSTQYLQPAESTESSSPDRSTSNAGPCSPPRGALTLLISRARGAFHRSANSTSSGDVFVDDGARPFYSQDMARSTASLPFPTVEAPTSSGGRFWQRNSERENTHSSPTKPGWLHAWGYAGKGKESGHHRFGRKTLLGPPLVGRASTAHPV